MYSDLSAKITACLLPGDKHWKCKWHEAKVPLCSAPLAPSFSNPEFQNGILKLF